MIHSKSCSFVNFFPENIYFRVNLFVYKVFIVRKYYYTVISAQGNDKSKTRLEIIILRTIKKIVRPNRCKK